MASDSNSSVVAIFAILIIALLGGAVAWRMGLFGGGGGGGGHGHAVEIRTK